MKTLQNHPFPQFARDLKPLPSCIAVTVTPEKESGKLSLMAAPVTSLGSE
jgi:hypothetical protein